MGQPDDQCENLNCPDHCCTVPIGHLPKKYHYYCCSVHEYFMQQLPPHPDMLFANDPGYHWSPFYDGNIGKKHVEDNKKEVTTPKPSLSKAQNITQHSGGDLSKYHAMGWSYVGVLSGIIVLLIFFMVMLSIIYIFHQWRRKYRSQGFFREIGVGREVVYRTSPPPQIEMQPYAEDAPGTSQRMMGVSPPPYLSERQENREMKLPQDNDTEDNQNSSDSRNDQILQSSVSLEADLATGSSCA